jgi:hypothetical protein
MLTSGANLTYQLNNAGHTTVSSTVLATNTWYVLHVVFDDPADQVRFYINGIRDATTDTNAGTPGAGVFRARVGANTDDTVGQFWDGSIALAAVYRDVLPDTMIRAQADDALTLLRLRRRRVGKAPVAAPQSVAEYTPLGRPNAPQPYKVVAF